MPSLGLDHQGPHPDNLLRVPAICPQNTALSRENQVEVIKLMSFLAEEATRVSFAAIVQYILSVYLNLS